VVFTIGAPSPVKLDRYGHPVKNKSSCLTKKLLQQNHIKQWFSHDQTRSMDSHKELLSPLIAYFPSSSPLDCIILHLHTRAFVGSVALILGNFIIAWDLIGMKYDWHEVWLVQNISTDVHDFTLLSFILYFSSSRQCFFFSIESFSFTKGTSFFLNLFLFFFFNLFSYLWQTNRQLHTINPNMLSWNVLEPWPYLALFWDFK